MLRTSICVLALVVIAAPLEAQVIQAPPRSTEGLFGGGRTPSPNATRNDLTLTLDAQGGWDDNLTPEGSGVSTNPFGAPQSGYTGFGAAGLRFRRGREARAFETTAGTYVNTYSDLHARALVGGNLNVQGHALLGRRNRFTAIGDVRYQPTLILGAFGPVANQVDGGVVSEPDARQGVTDLRSIGGGGSLDFSHEWTRSHQMTLRYEYAEQQFMDGPGLDSLHHVVGVRQDWEISRAATLNGSYRYMDQQMEDPDGGRRPLDMQSFEAGVELRRNLSRTRRIIIGGGGGATGVRSVTAADHTPFEYLSPSGYATARLDFGRTWALSGDFRRAPNVLEGLTNETFFTDAASLSLGGGLSRQLRMTVSGAYAHGSAHGTDRGAYESFSSIAQLLYGFTDCCALVASYGYYEHRIQDTATIIPGYPYRFERNSIRVGMTVGLPLYGTFESTGTADRR